MEINEIRQGNAIEDGAQEDTKSYI